MLFIICTFNLLDFSMKIFVLIIRYLFNYTKPIHILWWSIVPIYRECEWLILIRTLKCKEDISSDNQKEIIKRIKYFVIISGNNVFLVLRQLAGSPLRERGLRKLTYMVNEIIIILEFGNIISFWEILFTLIENKYIKQLKIRTVRWLFSFYNEKKW